MTEKEINQARDIIQAAKAHGGSQQSIILLEHAINEVERLRRDCAEAYQVVGAMTDEIDFTDTDVSRILDNLSAAANGEQRPHEDLLPWPHI